MRTPFLSSVLVLVVRMATAQSIDVPLVNWTVPPYRAASGGGITTMVDQTPPRAFIGLSVCRLLDTRPPANNPLDGDGIFATNQIRTYTLPGSCGIPTGTEAVSLNITVTNTVSNPFGHIKIWPADQAEPNVSTLNWAAGSVTESNAAIVALSVTEVGQIKVKSGNAGSDVIIDVNGYFSDVLGNPANTLWVQNNSDSPTLQVINGSTTCASFGGCGIRVDTESGTAIGGIALRSDGPASYGVLGSSNSTAPSGAGVRGTGVLRGVYGLAVNNLANAAGVFGTIGPIPITVTSSYFASGVRGEGTNSGVLGISPYIATSGSLVNGAGVEYAWGVLGLVAGAATDPGCPSSPCNGTWAVMAGGNIGATGLKHFLDPHPRDPNLAIAYVSLEGPEAGTYFRGRARFQNGIARIPVPEHFRLVTDPEGLTVQITPIGAMASFAVLRMDLNEIVVQASRNVEFSYLVQGVRATYKDVQPVRSAGDFMPRTADAKMPLWLSPAQRRILIQNGTYREDGTVNPETAGRLGWDKAWMERARPGLQPTGP